MQFYTFYLLKLGRSNQGGLKVRWNVVRMEYLRNSYRPLVEKPGGEGKS
jgi:hypothetical protein